MLTQFSYPIICTEKFKDTVNYYEDHLGFVPQFEIFQNFVILKRDTYADVFIAIVDAHSQEIPQEYRRKSSGIILNFPVEDVQKTYDEFYIEGLEVLNEPKVSICGRKHFFVVDPNGILIDVAENVPLSETVPPEKEDMISVSLAVATG
ncbi:MAG: glyoxalase [Alphaproteobacteria bacterium]|nr:glyoxalase [Alphaproteobacteria bacterium]